MDENSPTWMRPISVERVRMRGFRDRAHARVVDQRRHQVGGGVRIQHGVAVDADQVFAAGRQRAHAQRHGLALVLRQVHHAQPLVLRGQAIQHLRRAVAGAVVDGDDLDVG